MKEKEIVCGGATAKERKLEMARTIAEQLATEAKGLTFRELPPEVVHQVKRSVLDTVGIGFGGFLSEPSQIIQSLIKEMNGPAESTVFVSGLKTSCLYATLANGAMVRYLDYIDRCFLTREGRILLGHHCELIPPILAVGERQHTSGPEVITAVVLAYELLNKVYDSTGGNHGVLQRRGWTTETMGPPCIMALMAGRLLGLSEGQMANALAIAGCFTLEPRILHSPHATRNLRSAYGAYGGILGALLAQKGFKGPLNVFEGHHGLAEVVAGGEMDLDKLRQSRKEWTILYTWIKRFAADGDLQGSLEATLTLVKEHNIRPEDVAEIRIKTNSYTYGLADPAIRRYPNNRYTADHSCYYTTAVAILDRAVGPEQFSDEKLRDPRVRELLDKIVVESDPKLENFSSAGITEVTTKNGQKYRCEVLQPKGHPMNPMTDADVEEKFCSMAGKFMGEQQMRQIVDTVYNLEKIDDIGELVKLLVIRGQGVGQKGTG
ncbi:MAG: MmgE/PrpD family protein [Deltaproteobacteria bacterium]|nr:MmgE/PrpD family protein [Deltaproteobacteria bacterium]